MAKKRIGGKVVYAPASQTQRPEVSTDEKINQIEQAKADALAQEKTVIKYWAADGDHYAYYFTGRGFDSMPTPWKQHTYTEENTLTVDYRKKR